MSQKLSQTEPRTTTLRNIDARRRWELFHQAIAHAKQSNVAAMREIEEASKEPPRARPILYIAR